MAQKLSIVERKNFRNSVVVLEADCKANVEGHAKVLEACSVEHTFAPKVAVRHIKIKAGTMVIGKIHKTEHANIISQGACFVRTEFGEPEFLSAIDGPLHFVSPVGTKRIVLAVVDTWWSTIHPTDSDNEVDLEADVISESYEELIKYFPSMALDALGD